MREEKFRVKVEKSREKQRKVEKKREKQKKVEKSRENSLLLTRENWHS